ncbi:methyltransferase family protein [Pseudonocardia parietis]|uniref:Protein-S-isoprenylcysteine O-methyltransferase Ste14 n=1 Tax=Pseudonocardia parietis TaxID=570936 RepID=A0ABS4W722_9PSEU|nr:isoprenylcysteine carboxylmethyltransferase family protein [Pseudonocardia parietis]MBP2371424.1 protein-S-isoprenylcysteine O-methyltransferase Ste14 [Pseudonocardia parietis]
MLVQHLRAILLGPVTVTIIIPALIVTITGPAPVDLGPLLGYLALTVGALLIAGGVAMLAWTISLFAQQGEGTLSPQDPPRTLVVHGPYRHVRHPMFSAVLAILVGETIATRSLSLLAWLVVFALFVTIMVTRVEEPRLARRFGDDHARYRDNVPRWIPRLHPWEPPPRNPTE